MAHRLATLASRPWRTTARSLAWALPLLSALWVLLVPVFLVSTNVRLAFDTPRLYLYGFDRYDVSSRTGLSRAELARVAGDIRAYFHDGRELLDTRVRLRGEERPLFNRREQLHMRDVKALVQGVGWVQVAAGAYLAAFAAVGLAVGRAAFAVRLGRLALVGGLGTVALVLVVGLLLLVAFDALFLLFHELSFANDFWMLDPSRDYLVALFPQGFWFEATMLVAVATVVEALALAGVGALARRRAR